MSQGWMRAAVVEFGNGVPARLQVDASGMGARCSTML